MLDQIFGRMFASQWIVFVGLVILLVGLSELAWRMGLASSREKSEGAKDSGTVRSAVLALLGLLLGFSFAIAAVRNVHGRTALNLPCSVIEYLIPRATANLNADLRSSRLLR
jgi:hypothetical protein